MSNETLRILLVQQFFPPYRVPVFSKLASHPQIALTLIHGTSPGVASGEIGLVNVTQEMPFRVIRGPISRLRWRTKQLLWFGLAVKTVTDERFDVVIHNFATRWASLGKIGKLQQKKGGKFILWGIGFSQTKTPVLNLLRMRMVNQADALILYSKRDRKRYIDLGACHDKVFVARNSIDLGPIDHAISEWPEDRLEHFRREKGLQEGPILLHVGRLADNKGLHLLLNSAANVKHDYPGLKVVLIGNGPHKEHLQKLSCALGLADRVLFPGKINNEAEIAPWFLASDIIVAPGQIGLLAPHTHAYGQPLVTSDNPVMHGPEIEIVKPGETGLFYPYGDVHALTSIVKSLLADKNKRESIGAAAFQRARQELGIPNMVNGVLKAISYVTGQSLTMFNC